MTKAAPIPHSPASGVLRVAAASRGADIEWAINRSRQLSLSNIDSLLAIPDDQAFLAAAYEVVLGRRADPAGSAFYVHALAEGMDRGGLLLTLAESPEGREHARAAHIRALLCAHRVGGFLEASGSVIDRAHLWASGRIDQVWPLLWAEAVREVIPGTLTSAEDMDAFVTAIGGGKLVAEAVADAWKASLPRASVLTRLLGRLRLRFAWHSTWARVHARFRSNLVFFTAVGELLAVPSEHH